MNTSSLIVRWLAVMLLGLCVGGSIVSSLCADTTAAPIRGSSTDHSGTDMAALVSGTDATAGPTWLTSSGTAFVVHPAGYLITHATQVKAPDFSGLMVHRTTLQVILGERRYGAKVVQIDPKTELALIKIDAVGLPFLPLGDSSSVPLGEDTRVFGFPQDRMDIEHALRVVRASVAGFEMRDSARWLLTEQPYARGISGAPLVNPRGDVVGVATPNTAQKTFGVGAPINELREWLKTVGLDLPISAGKEILDGATLASRATPALARIEVGAVHVTLQTDLQTVDQVMLSPDGSQLATCSPKQSRLWNLVNGSYAMLPQFSRAIFSPGGGYVALVSESMIRIYDLHQRKVITTIPEGAARDIQFLPDDSSLLLMVDDGIVQRKKEDQFQTVERLLTSPEGESWQRFVPSPDGQKLAVQLGFTDQNTQIQIWNLARHEPPLRWPTTAGSVRRMAFSLDGRQIMTTHYQETRFWDTTTGTLLRTTKCRGFYVEWPATVSQFVVLRGNDLQFLDGQTAAEQFQVRHEAGFAYGDEHLALSADRRAIAVSGQVTGTPPGPVRVSLLSIPDLRWQAEVRNQAMIALRERGFSLNPPRVTGIVFDEAVAQLFEQANTFDEFSDLNLSGSALTEQDLIQVGRLQKLQRLNLDHTPIRDSWLSHLANLGELRNLELTNTPITDAGLVHLRTLSKLEYLHLARTMVVGVGLEHLAELRQLKTVWLYHTPTGDEAIPHLARLQGLRTLDLEGSQITGKNLELLRQLPLLTSLDLSSTSLRDDALPAISQLVGLQTLELDGTFITDRGLAELVRLPVLSSLRLDDTATTDAGLEYIGEIHKLNRLFLDRTLISDAGLKWLPRLPLIEISLNETRVTDQGVLTLSTWPKLNDLSLSGTRVTDRGVAMLKSRSDMRYLHLNQTLITDEALKTIGAFQELRWLELANTGITGAGLANLANLQHVWSLNLTGTKITDEGIQALAGWKNLENVRVNETLLTDAGVKALAELSSLELIDLQKTQVSDTGLGSLGTLPHLQSLYVTGTTITDDGLKLLSACTNLENLLLTDTAITERGIQYLRTCGKLRWLNLTRTQVTPAVWAELVALPSLRYLQLGETKAGGPPVLTLLDHRFYSQLQSIYLDHTAATGVNLVPWKSFTNLQQISLKGLPITDAGLDQLAELPNLQYLILEGTQVTDHGLAKLSAASKLSTLNLNHTSVTDAGLRALGSLLGLNRLMLDGTEVTGSGLRELAQLPNLQELTWGATGVGGTDLAALKIATNLRKLDLHDTKLANEVLSQIAQLDTLRELDLSGVPLSSVDLAELRPLQRLRVLKLNRAAIDETGLDVLSQLTSLSRWESQETSIGETQRLSFSERLRARIAGTIAVDPLPVAEELRLTGQQATWFVPPLRSLRVSACDVTENSQVRESPPPFNRYTLKGVKTTFSFANPFVNIRDAEFPYTIRYRNAYGTELGAIQKTAKITKHQTTPFQSGWLAQPSISVWSEGLYFVEVEWDGQLVGRTRFEVRHEPEDARPPLLDIYFYESDGRDLAIDQRTHHTSFDTAKTRYINTEFVYRNMHEGIGDTPMKARVEYVKRSGKVIGQWEHQGMIPKDWTTVNAQGGWGSKTAGSWDPGQYAALIYIDGQYVGGAPFLVTGRKPSGSPAREEVDVNDTRRIGGPYMPRAAARPRSRGRSVSWDRIQLPMEAYSQAEGSYWVGRAWVDRDAVVALKDAVAYYTNYLKRYPNSSWAYHMRAIAYDANDNHELAQKDINQAIKMNPKEPRYYVTRSRCTDDESLWEADLKKALSLDPEHAPAHFELGAKLMNRLGWDFWYDEVFYLEEILGATRWANFEAEFELTRSQFDECMQHYDEAIRLDPGLIDAYFERALGWMMDENLPRAIEDFTKVIEAMGTGTSTGWRHWLYLPADFYYLRAVCYEAHGDDRLAISDFETALRRFPKSFEEEGFETRRHLARLLATVSDAKSRDPQRAIQYAQQMHAFEERKSAEQLFVLAYVYAAAGDFDAAMAWQAKAQKTCDWESGITVAYRRLLDSDLRRYEHSSSSTN